MSLHKVSQATRWDLGLGHRKHYIWKLVLHTSLHFGNNNDSSYPLLNVPRLGRCYTLYPHCLIQPFQLYVGGNIFISFVDTKRLRLKQLAPKHMASKRQLWELKPLSGHHSRRFQPLSPVSSFRPPYLGRTKGYMQGWRWSLAVIWKPLWTRPGEHGSESRKHQCVVQTRVIHKSSLVLKHSSHRSLHPFNINLLIISVFLLTFFFTPLTFYPPVKFNQQLKAITLGIKESIRAL